MVDYQSRDTRSDDGDEASDAVPDREKTGGEDPDRVEAEDGPVREKAGEDGSAREEGQTHDHHAHDRSDLGVGVVTVSSSRSFDADASGDAIESVLEGAGHEVVTRELVRDSRDTIQSVVDTLVGRRDVDIVVTTGGTGVSPDDVTVEAVRPLFEKDLPGFGEVFRSLSYEEIGTKVVGTRATAGVANAVPVFTLPGSESAARLATEEIILPEAGHLAGLATRGRDTDGE